MTGALIVRFRSCYRTSVLPSRAIICSTNLKFYLLLLFGAARKFAISRLADRPKFSTQYWNRTAAVAQGVPEFDFRLFQRDLRYPRAVVR